MCKSVGSQNFTAVPKREWKVIPDLQREQERIQFSKDGAYKEYVSGGMTPDEYRNRADELDQQAELLSEQIHDSQEELSVLEEELERMNADMKQIIRYFHYEETDTGISGYFY